MRAVALIALVACAACRETTSPVNPTPPPPPPPAASVTMTLSGSVFEVIPGGRVPAPGIRLVAVVVSDASCAPPCSSKRVWTREATTSGPDGRYQFATLPPGPAIVLADSRSHQQVCGAARAAGVTTDVDVEITSSANPLPSPTMPPLRVAGQIYETTPSGRVGVAGASIGLEWLAQDSLFITVNADRNGRYSICGIPPNAQIAFWTIKTGYTDTYVWHEFTADMPLDIELTRK